MNASGRSERKRVHTASLARRRSPASDWEPHVIRQSEVPAPEGFTSGLRQRLYPLGVTVITIKPGFVDTPMTAAFPKGALWAKPQQIANGIVSAVDRGSATVLYTYLGGMQAVIAILFAEKQEQLIATEAFTTVGALEGDFYHELGNAASSIAGGWA